MIPLKRYIRKQGIRVQRRIALIRPSPIMSPGYRSLSHGTQRRSLGCATGVGRFRSILTDGNRRRSISVGNKERRVDKWRRKGMEGLDLR
jgi:hypothetical protein